MHQQYRSVVICIQMYMSAMCISVQKKCLVQLPCLLAHRRCVAYAVLGEGSTVAHPVALTRLCCVCSCVGNHECSTSANYHDIASCCDSHCTNLVSAVSEDAYARYSSVGHFTCFQVAEGLSSLL